MCGSMADIQSAAAEIRRGKKERRKKKNKQQDGNIMVCPITYRTTIIRAANLTTAPGGQRSCYATVGETFKRLKATS